MKLFLVFSALVLAAAALPTDIDREVDFGAEADLGTEPNFGVEADLGTDTDLGAEAILGAEADLGTGTEIDHGIEPEYTVEQLYYENANFSNARVPWGQAGFATMNGGTHGGNGGATWTVWDGWALRDAVRGNDRRVVYVRGRIDLSQLFTGSPGVRFDVGSYKTVIGGDRNAMIFGGGLVISRVRQVIIQNIKFHNALSYAPGERPNGSGGIIGQVPGAFSEIDNLGITNNAENVWVNHCEFADDPWNAINTPGDRRRHDGLIDIVRGASFISISNCIFRNHNHVSLVGNGENVTSDRGRLKTTWYLNWFQGVVQRCPLVRFGEVHVLNNLYTGVTFYAIGVGVEASIYAERNAFLNSRSAWVWAVTGGGVPNPRGYLFNFNNIFVNSPREGAITGGGVTWRPERYYQYTAMAAANVEAHVRRHAGTY